MAAVINEMSKRKKEQHEVDNDNECLSHTNNKKARRVVWSDDLHAKFVDAVTKLGLHDAVPRKIVALMNVDGITTAHVASHLQKYRLRNKKAADSSLIDQPTQSQNISFNKKAADRVPSSSLIQPTQSQNIIHPPFYKFPVTQNTTLLPNKMPVHQSHTVPAEIYSNTTGVSPLFPTLVNHSATAFDFHDTMAANFPLQMNSHHTHDVLGSASSTLIQPIQSQNHMFPVYHQTSTFPTLVNHSTTPLGFPTTFDFHDTRATNYPFVGSAFSKTTSILDDDWYTKYMNMEPHLLQFPNNSFSVLESDKTSQNSQMKNSQQTKPFIDGSPSSLEDTNINISESNLCNENSLMKNSHQPEPFIDASPSSLEDTNIDISESNLCSENSPIDFSVETNCNTLEWGCLEEDLINVWRWLEEENVTNVML